MESGFYCSIDENGPLHQLIANLRTYSEETVNPIYIIDKLLGIDNKTDYDYDDRAIILIPKCQILVVNLLKEDTDDFEDFYDDLISDIGFLSKKYNYEKHIGRKRNWNDLVIPVNYADINSIDALTLIETYRVPAGKERITELLISLMVGSVNDIEKVGVETPETLLEKVKKKIVLFDGMQSRFIYENSGKKQIRIQGLAGTGKTELLLHRLKEVYVNEQNSKIAFTCFNEVLAKDMHTRIPHFFNFMKVEEQIEWNKRLWVFRSWGSRSIPNSGLYSYICNYYNLKFLNLRDAGTFSKACRLAIEELNLRGEIEPCFDYIFIDESQDFSEDFFELCDMITSKQVYIAGDIFQNIFDSKINKDVQNDYLLNKCYRTDPKTLMLAHSIGMGLYEMPVLQWLEDDEWEACGYSLRRNAENQTICFNRKPLRRFEDIEDSGTQSVQIKAVPGDNMTRQVMDCIQEIINNNHTVQPDDIAVIILDSMDSSSLSLVDELVYRVKAKFKWESTKGYITKYKEKGKVFISNVNNVKGLEFPFIICVKNYPITSNLRQRNGIYMALTRSFLFSYFLVNNANSDFLSIYQTALEGIHEKGYIEVREPSESEKREQAEKVRIELTKKSKSIGEIIDEVCQEYSMMTYEEKHQLHQIISRTLSNFKDEDEDDVKIRIRKTISGLFGYEGEEVYEDLFY